MRAVPSVPSAPAPAVVAVLASVLVTAGCTVASGTPTAGPEPAPDLSFAYEAEGGEGYIDQVLTITNTGDVAAVPRFAIVPLDARGVQVRGIRVDTALGSDHEGQVVPAHTAVIDVLRFVGSDAAEVVDVRVEEVEPGPFDADVPPANDLRVQRYDVTGSTTSESTLGRVEVANPHDGWVRVEVVGLEYADGPGSTQQFTRVTELAGPLDVAPGRTVGAVVDPSDRGRFYGSVRAFLVR